MVTPCSTNAVSESVSVLPSMAFDSCVYSTVNSSWRRRLSPAESGRRRASSSRKPSIVRNGHTHSGRISSPRQLRPSMGRGASDGIRHRPPGFSAPGSSPLSHNVRTRRVEMPHAAAVAVTPIPLSVLPFITARIAKFRNDIKQNIVNNASYHADLSASLSPYALHRFNLPFSLTPGSLPNMNDSIKPSETAPQVNDRTCRRPS